MFGSNFQFLDIVILVTLIVAVVVFAMFMLNRWAAKKYGAQKDMIDKAKQTVSIYVIDKKRARAADAHLPKAIMENLPRVYKVTKMNLIKAKVGPQITTLLCDKKVYEVMPVKKNVKVDLAGIYIIEVKGVKSKKELKAQAKQKKKNAE